MLGFGVVFASFFAWFGYGVCLLFCLVLVWCLLAFLLGLDMDGWRRELYAK